MNELTKPEKSAVVLAEDLAKYAGVGMEGATANDFAIPFAHILQKLSPQVDEASGNFVPGARAGQIFISTSSKCYDGKAGISVIPCAFKKNLVEWKPRNSGGGFVKEHQWNEELIAQTEKNDKGQLILANGHLLVETKLHYILILDEVDTVPAVISMTSTQLKKSRKLMSLISMRKLKTSEGKQFLPPSFAFMYKLTVVPETNEHGSWFSWDVEPGPQVANVELLREAIKFHKAINAGEVKLVDSSPVLGEDDIPF